MCLRLFQVIVTLLSRFACGGTIYALREFVLIDIATFIDRLFAGHPHLLLFAVMVMCPVLMNLIQAWIQDNILKWKNRKMMMIRPPLPISMTTHGVVGWVPWTKETEIC